MMTLLVPSFKWILAFSMLVGEDTNRIHNTLSTIITPCDIGRILLLEDSDKLPLLSLDFAIKLAMVQVILGHADHVVEVKEDHG